MADQALKWTLPVSLHRARVSNYMYNLTHRVRSKDPARNSSPDKSGDFLRKKVKLEQMASWACLI